MKFILKVTAITKIADDRILVQLQGQYGNAQLDLPNNHQDVLHVGQDFELSSETDGPKPPDLAPDLARR
jgi:hypothetical protein